MCWSAYVCMRMCGWRSTSGIFLCHSPPYFVRYGLSLNRELTDCVDWLDSKPLGAAPNPSAQNEVLMIAHEARYPDPFLGSQFILLKEDLGW